jgi:hypothetical protein
MSALARLCKCPHGREVQNEEARLRGFVLTLSIAHRLIAILPSGAAAAAVRR